MATRKISRRHRLVAADLVGENAEVIQESVEKKPPPPRKRKFLSYAASADVVDEKDYSLLLKKNLYFKISRCRRLVAADLAGENAEVLRESEGEDASAAAEEEAFGLEVTEGNLLLYSVLEFPQVLVLRC
ncbi:uncharacterized protein G2W53_014886 [Senna tora]|uniref:Uncharacterized protein n=1 Tax=Senna tora TaxID=362788 RepID=A0A834WU25_9FABA|nr:uncharacterized protein G2W53_014886 [Senna tora]